MRHLQRTLRISLVFTLFLAVGCGKEEPTQEAPQAGGAPATGEAVAPPPSGQTAQQAGTQAAAEPSAGDTPQPGSPSLAQEAENTFAIRCATCHGGDGTGNGPAAAAMNPKPRDYTNKEWQASVQDEDLKTAIVKGGAAVGKSPMMPAHPDLGDKPELLDALVAHIRGFAQE
ncbi:c-type cytochrome [Haliangium ochraceum]|uniref:Cytochrome c domain-containing protein n=1 Tax=Haliangium ochraceum (strain DSM 14365 / JCM 11303 / SMP-2) TaxID=502025 RepID=D0LT20_HALO1|nr:c-type cytochrome [Haliangium ochraceum]ACY19156.1 hypothetical protein Hoch_6691 [Haliangium ochraceum DSM 14365]